MRLKFIALLSAVALVAACESTPDDEGTSGAGGMGADGTITQSSVETSGTGMSRSSGLPPEQELIAIGDRVFFQFDQYDLTPEARGTLEGQAALLRNNEAILVVVEGHADERGTREYNLALGERRATVVKDYLVAQGISPVRIRTISYGEERPDVVGSNDQAWAQNRRGVTVITSAAAGS